MISHEAWKNRYQGDPDIVGKTQYLNGVQHTIIGVTPENFHGTFVGVSFQFWVPISMQETFDPTGYKLEDRNARAFESFVFLKPGVTPRQAEEELSALARRLEADYQIPTVVTKSISGRCGEAPSMLRPNCCRHSRSRSPLSCSSF